MGKDAIDLGTPNPRGTHLANLSIIFGTISTVLVIARIVTRITIFKRTGADDYCIIVASVSDIDPSRTCVNITDTVFSSWPLRW